MFETFEDILNQHIFVPSTFSGIAICEVKYFITNVNHSVSVGEYSESQIIGPRSLDYTVDFQILGTNIELSNNNYG